MAINNLSVENLSRLVDVGGTPGGGVSSEASVIREMQKNGMPQPGASPESSGPTSFSDMLSKSVNQVNLDQHQADLAVKEMISGRNKNIHETMLAVERADTSLKLMMQVRNKVLDAYKEIMRMQV